jgi:hypothetical protein
MKLKPIVDQLLKAQVGITNIHGAADFTQAQQHVKTGGTIFVVLLSETGSPNRASWGVRQDVAVRVGIFIGLQDVAGARGKGIDDLDEVVMDVRRAMIPWTHPQASDHWTWSRGQLAGVEQSWLWWREEFTAPAILSMDQDEDGLIPQRLFLGIAPNIGPAHEDEYFEVDHLPEVGP